MRFRSRTILFSLLAALSVATVFFRMEYLSSGHDEEVSSYTSARVSRPKKWNATTRAPVVVFPKAKPKEQNKTAVQDYIRHFEKEYSHDYPSKADEFFNLLQKIASRTWVHDARKAETFRKDILAATGNLSSRSFLYVTKQNSPVGSNLSFCDKPNSFVKVSDDFWKDFPDKTVFESRERFKRCSIVGSSGILSGSGCGEEIDKADFVFRFNLAKVQGLEGDVGSKTNFSTLNPSFAMSRLNSLKGKQYLAAFSALQRPFQGALLWLPLFTVRPFYKFARRLAGVVSADGIMKSAYQHPGHFLAMMRLWTAVHHRRVWPSTGLYAVSSAFELCDQIHVFGFWHFAKPLHGNRTVPYHYYNNVTASRRHDFLKEFQSLVKFHEMGVIKMHFGSCS